ncbi:MAG: conserved hypothetical secreted protein [Candidatus Acidoferrum typicum]|nr:conserved hypothetical secreted protein [Candidatus Acidoferrum typicum]
MKTFRSATFLVAVLLGAMWYGLDNAPATGRTSSPPKPPVYVSDFDIDVELPQSGIQKPEDDPGNLASHLVELMSTKLVIALQKAGYSATRMHEGDARPDSGVQIRGLFAEVDEENHWRRAVIRSATDSGKMEALVAVANLSKPEQALYEIAPLPGNEDRPGAVITLSPYVPLTKYDLSKDADENVFKGIAPRVVNDLTDLLNRNPAAITQ